MSTETSADKKLGIALGGGGSRAFVHLGALKVLAEHDIKVSCVAGSSMGAILGAMYAIKPDAKLVRERAFEYFAKSRFFGRDPKPAKNDGLHPRTGVFGWIGKYLRSASIANIICLRRGLLRHNQAHTAIDDLIPDQTIESTKLPFACNALNLTQGSLATLTSGPLRPALKAGTAVGVVFAPYRWENDDFVDAAPVASVPVHACRALGADIVLAIDIRTPIPKVMGIQNGFDVISRVEMIESKRINDAEASEADLLLQPDVGTIFWGDFTHLEQILEIGEAAMREKISDLRALLR